MRGEILCEDNLHEQDSATRRFGAKRCFPVFVGNTKRMEIGGDGRRFCRTVGGALADKTAKDVVSFGVEDLMDRLKGYVKRNGKFDN